MSSGCGDVLSLEDLKTAKKHQLFEAEVITGLQGGVAGGASIDYATNQVTGQVQKTMPAVLRDVGFTPVSWDFSTGGTLTITDRDKVVYDPVSKTWYSYAGTLPVTVPAGFNPVGNADWTPQTDPNLRNDLLSTSDTLGDALLMTKFPTTGSVARTQHNKNADEINIKDFGAVCDGVTDDSAAIQAAFASGGGTKFIRIKFPANSRVKIGSKILVPSRVQCDFNGAFLLGVQGTIMFETGYFLSGVLTSNISLPLGEGQFLTDIHFKNGFILDAELGFNLYYFTANCLIKNMRSFGANGMLHAKESFYAGFENIHCWSPTVTTARPAFWWDGDIQAQGVRKCYASGGFAVGHRIQGYNDAESFSTCSAEGCTTGIYFTGGTGEGGLQNMEIHNWYLEGNTTAMLFDSAYTYQRINIRNCFFGSNVTHIDGATVMSGSMDETNTVNDTVAAPGNIRLGNLNNGKNGFKVRLQPQWSTTNIFSPTIDTAVKQTGVNVVLERDLTLAHPTTSVPAYRTTERYGLVQRDCIGSAIGPLSTNMVPFCQVTIVGTAVTINTRIVVNPHEMFSFSLTAETAGGPVHVSGTVINGVVLQQSSSQRPVTVSTGTNACYALSFSSVASAVSSCAGAVRIL